MPGFKGMNYPFTQSLSGEPYRNLLMNPLFNFNKSIKSIYLFKILTKNLIYPIKANFDQ